MGGHSRKIKLRKFKFNAPPPLPENRGHYNSQRVCIHVKRTLKEIVSRD
jgi:hypothetical protein